MSCVAGIAVKDRIAGPLSLVQQESHSTEGCVQQALDLNLARALMLSSRSTEAVEKFKQLEASGELPWLYADDRCLMPMHLFFWLQMPLCHPQIRLPECGPWKWPFLLHGVMF